MRAGNEDFPDAGVAALPHHMGTAVPAVEVACHRHACCIGRPHREMHALMPLVPHRVCAQPVMEAEVVALANVMVIERPQHRPEQIGVGHRPAATRIARQVAERLAVAERQRAFEEASLMAARQPHEALAVLVEDFQFLGTGHEGAHHPVIAGLVQSKRCKGVAVSARYDGLDLGRGQCPVRVGHVASAPRRLGRARCRGHIPGSSGRTRTTPCSPY